MITFYHAPKSRSTAIAVLIEEMGISDRVDMKLVDIVRADGSGAADPKNPHPESKAPVLIHDGHVITERGAIMLYLTTLFPDRGMAPAVGTPDWGSLATWLAWYQGVLEPVLIHAFAGLSHPFLASTFRGPAEAATRIRAALEKGPWLLGDQFSAADLLVHSPYAWFEDATPDDPLIRDWVERCKARPARLKVFTEDEARMTSMQRA